MYNYGPAYLLNGLGNTGYWYQVGVSYNWNPNAGNAGLGFHLAYEVFNSSGSSVFPTNGGGGLDTLSPVNQGDTILLSLGFSSSNVIMQGTDQNTGAHAQETYSAAGATSFIGSPSGPSNSRGFFSGLMTEWYHSSAYYGGEQRVTYQNNGIAVTSAWMWIEEITVSQTSGITGSLFSDYTRSPMTFTNPAQLQTFSSNGATEAASATQFITGGVSPIALTFGYSIAGGTGASLSPILTYIVAGVQQTANLTSSDQTFSMDTGTSWSITNPLPGSSPAERWQTVQSTTGIANSPVTIEFMFYHQYLVTFGFTVVGGGTGYSAPAVSCLIFGIPSAATLGSQIWADSAQYNFPVSLAGSSSSERWASTPVSGLISSSGGITANYYHQYLMNANYAINGGGTPGSPTLNSTVFGSSLSQSLTPQAQGFWIDSGASYSITNPLTGSSATERWQSLANVTGSMVSPSTISVIYYHQYLIPASYAVVGGGTPGSPTLNSTAFGLPLSQILTTQPQGSWIDSGAPYSFTNPLPGSAATERWQSNTAIAGNSVSSSGVSVTYYHQYLIPTSYAVVGGVTPGSPTLNSTAFGSPLAQAVTTLPQGIWIDNGASYSFTNPLPGSTATERWQSEAAATDNLVSPNLIRIFYQHQYYVTANLDPVAGGSISPMGGWFDAGTTFQALASANSGWQFENWQGSGQGAYSGANSDVLAVVNAPLIETAILYPGLTITASNRISVSYAYGTIAASIPGGTSDTIFTPQGTSIQLKAKPEFFIYSFSGWTGSTTNAGSAISTVLNSPMSLTANYSYNYVNIGIVSMIALAVIICVVFIMLRKRRPKLRVL